ncbi:TetR/AcrR family transcriptional regulator [Nesterenkonia aerolata]|uniref:TetR/AcrR family transcriptional regulator n=1 Tax=Nesterenkonia aerolata TaxID=3074079 RepID=A0ABU2DP08_9MICC|nr:TetR/AcrR family transcriptional regulator [Nesterenkonia sp. LY-0111]MDR8018253.1 TetR/AcrR family transcriptional regulator [Nesterenkonia sp. LY-0111]
MPKISEAQRQARRDQISQAAVEQFAARGIHSTSMANIIDASGLSSGAIYTHFSSKDEIIAHVARTTVSSVFSRLEEILNSDPLPRPELLITLITERIAQTNVPTGFIVQVWAEAVTNPVVHNAANEVYAEAFEFFREYVVLWLSTGGGLDPRQARAQAPRRARLMISLIYAHILQTPLIDSHNTCDFVNDTGDLFTVLTR